MERQTWVGPNGYKATGLVDSGGKMTQATVERDGFTVDRNRSFSSQADFYGWAQRASGRL